MSLKLEYFYGREAEQYNFYRIPKILLTDRRYRSVSMEAKVLYGLMLDRMGLSVRNGWLDEKSRLFIYFTLEDSMRQQPWISITPAKSATTWPRAFRGRWGHEDWID